MANPVVPVPDVYRSIVQSTTEYAMLYLSPEGRIQTWNPGAERVFGYTQDEAIGQHYSILFREEDRDSGVPLKELQRADADGAASNTRWLVRKDGQAFWAEGVTSAVRDAGGALVGYAKVARNAAERQRMEQALERTNDELQRFAFTISHDLQEPLRTVRSYAELLERRYKGKLDEDAHEFIHYMVDGTKRMGQLLKDILAYSQAGREDKTRPEPTQAANVLQWAHMNVDGLLKQSGGTLTWDPMPTIMVDQTQCASLFQHLFTNAIKFRSPEPPKIHVSAEPVDNMWQFSVNDNGVGVDPEYHERIFGVFKRLANRDVPGTGIGLAICRKIVEAHGGKIWFESQRGQGSTVKFTLPSYD
jgi:PAS domain S-box-containing protein